jgi:multiple sugar transport system permease protein
MSWNKFTNTMATLIVYLLVIGGAIIMVMPFAWMVVTSLKTGSEISQWPPKWSTKNFKSEISVSLKNAPSTSIGGQGSLSLVEFRASNSSAEYNEFKKVLNIEDDKIRRGEVSLNFSKLNYANNEDLENMVKTIKEFSVNYALIPEISNEIIYLENTPESFENFYFKLYSTSNGLFKKSQILKNLNKELQDAVKYIDTFISKTLDRLPYLRINDNDNSVVKQEKERKKEELKIYLENLKNNLDNLIVLVDNYSRGTGIISNGEINDILANIDSINFMYFTDMYLRNVNRLLEKNIYNPIIYNKNTLIFKSFFDENYEKMQNYKADSLVIRFNIPNKDEMKENFLNALSQSNIPQEFKEFIDTNADILDIKDNFILGIEHHYNDIVLEKLNITSADLSRTLIIIRTLTKYDDLNDVLKYLSIFDREFVIEKDLDLNELIELTKLRKEYNKIIDQFNNLYSDSISLVNLIEAPEIVDKVYYRNYSNIEIYFKDIYAIWFVDEVPKMSVKFTPKQVFANIFQNYVDAWHAAPFSKYYVNTVFMATSTTILEIIFAAMAAFAFAKLEFWGKNFIFTLFLATMMVPGEVMLVPNFITISKFRWLDTYYALIIPWVVSVFAIFLLRQQFMTIPNDLWDAAKIDGSSSWRFLWTVMVPLSKPALITGALLKFVGSWNAFLWVLIVTKSPEMRTLAVGLQTFTTESGTMYNLLMAASTFSIIPIIILFIFMQKYFVAGIARSGLKG